MAAKAESLSHGAGLAESHLSDSSMTGAVAPDEASGTGLVISSAVREAMKELLQAEASRKPEHICVAYQSLRQATHGTKIRDLFSLLQHTLGPAALDMIVSAWSHRKCFMCSSGLLACDACEGDGQLEDNRTCPNCDGLGVNTCGFCRGTGWADRDLIPHEISKVVTMRQLGQVIRDLKLLPQAIQQTPPENIRRLPVVRRHELIGWMVRLHGRSTAMLEANAVSEDRLKAPLAEAVRLTGEYLDAVRAVTLPKTPTEE